MKKPVQCYFLRKGYSVLIDTGAIGGVLALAGNGGWGVWGEGRSPCPQRLSNKKRERGWAKPNLSPFWWLRFLAPFGFPDGA